MSDNTQVTVNHLNLEGLCLNSMFDRFSEDQLQTLYINIAHTIEKKLKFIRNSIEDHIKLLLDDSMIKFLEIKFLEIYLYGTTIRLYITTYGDGDPVMEINTFSNYPFISYGSDCFVNNTDLNTFFDDKTNLKLTSVIEYMKTNPQLIYLKLKNNFTYRF
jgi:hypothetical protein